VVDVREQRLAGVPLGGVGQVRRSLVEARGRAIVKSPTEETNTLDDLHFGGDSATGSGGMRKKDTGRAASCAQSGK